MMRSNIPISIFIFDPCQHNKTQERAEHVLENSYVVPVSPFPFNKYLNIQRERVNELGNRCVSSKDYSATKTSFPSRYVSQIKYNFTFTKNEANSFFKVEIFNVVHSV